mgnify:CR=1 FL=1
MWWGAPGNTEAFSQWLVIDELSANGSGFSQWLANVDEGITDPLPKTGWQDLAEATTFTDLTRTLPEAIRADGWHAGRAEDPGLVPPAIDELSANGSGLAARSCHRLPHPIL